MFLPPPHACSAVIQRDRMKDARHDGSRTREIVSSANLENNAGGGRSLTSVGHVRTLFFFSLPPPTPRQRHKTTTIFQRAATLSARNILRSSFRPLSRR